MRRPRARWPAIALLATLALAGFVVARAASPSVYGTRFQRTPTPTELTMLGRAMFFDPALSASGRMACASCHDPAHAYGPPNDRAVQLGGATMREPGVRAVPSLRYLQAVPRFTEHFVENEGGRDGEDQGPAGGLTWDGRADTTHDQAALPLLSPFEMANADEAAVVARLARSSYAGELRAAFGANVLDDAGRGFAAAVLALEVFQQSPADFYPYASRYDDVLRGRATLTPAEARGLALFEDPAKGNCASCHPSQVGESGLPAFTDFGYNALGVPRNAAIPANRDPRYRDLGLCGPYRVDLASHREYCGFFRAPSLRNVAVRRVFFHNGAIRSLADAVRFYVERDVRPERWYPRRAGRVATFDDLPKDAMANVDREPPFGGKRGDRPALSDDEIADIVAFLRTLTDRDVARAARDERLRVPREARDDVGLALAPARRVLDVDLLERERSGQRSVEAVDEDRSVLLATLQEAHEARDDMGVIGYHDQVRRGVHAVLPQRRWISPRRASCNASARR